MAIGAMERSERLDAAIGAMAAMSLSVEIETGAGGLERRVTAWRRSGVGGEWAFRTTWGVMSNDDIATLLFVARDSLLGIKSESGVPE